MFRRDSCAIVLLVCLLLYFDATVCTEKLEETDRRLRSTSEKYRLKKLHDSRIESLIARSEKSLRASSSSDDGKKNHFSSRRKNSWDDQTKKRSGMLKTRTREEKYKHRKNKSRKQPRLLNVQKSLTKKNKPAKEKIKPIRGCWMGGNGDEGGYSCRGSSRKRDKRETNYPSIPRLNISGLPWGLTFPQFWPQIWTWFG